MNEDYVSFEIAKLLKEKGFIKDVDDRFSPHFGYNEDGNFSGPSWDTKYNAPTLQMTMKWLREVHNVLVILDYDYECTDKSYCYKIYKLGENGKPERVPIEGVSYDMFGEPHTHIVAYRDYERSYSDYKTYEEACEAGIRYCLENLI